MKKQQRKTKRNPQTARVFFYFFSIPYQLYIKVYFQFYYKIKLCLFRK